MPNSVFIKNIVSNRCKLIITQLFKDFNLLPENVFLGEVVLQNKLSKAEIEPLKLRLEQYGYELITDNGAKITSKIKSVLADLIETESFNLEVNMSRYITDKLHYEYHYLSNLFSDIENTSIEKYYILLKIEKAKDYIDEGLLSISEIAFKLGYSSPAHLTNQFKQVTGSAPTHYKNLLQSKIIDTKKTD